MRHVLVFNQFALPRSQGGSTRHADLFGRLHGWSALIVAGNRNHYSQQTFSTDDPLFRLVAVPQQAGGSVARLLGWLAYGAQALALGLTRPQLDLVYGSSPQPLAALAGLAVARMRRVPFILEVRDLWPASAVSAGRLSEGSPAHAVFGWVERLLTRNAFCIVCVTDGWQEHFDRIGVPGHRLVIVPNGSEPSDFEVKASRQELRAQYAVRGFTAVFAGAHGPKDGIDFILDAARQLPDVDFLLVGSGPVKAEKVAQARRERLSNVEFRDPMPKPELARLLRACDVGVHAVTPLAVFDQGMSPNKLFDYMAAGLPVVSNAATALGRIVRDGECGRLGGPGDLTRCLAAVHQASPEQREMWGQRSGQVLRQRFSRCAAAAELRRVLDDALGRPADVEVAR